MFFSAVISWPEGQYGLPMTEFGCPDTDNLRWSRGKFLCFSNENK